jgi:hypothetical protein
MPDHAVYLEYEQEELSYVSSSVALGESDDDISFDEDSEVPLEVVDESIFFMPVYLYRNPLVGCMKFDINFDPSEYDRLHLVVVRFSQQDEDQLIGGKWFVEGIYKTRREAKEIEFAIESGDYSSEKELPWKGSGVELDGVSVVTLALED